ncbi:uncharacterized protein LOC109860946 [Pseudomyrmex gracilis]|uniref:uncharacterized protein LOC109860946 n=1 Tax=Pseudomyrmex gracilis TaxID=219809 RepID=UPI000994C8D1|nr:uncharacterized protein LOC109860946 [Pseudomyrmex gracilis]
MSGKATRVLARMLPIDIMARQRAAMFERRGRREGLLACPIELTETRERAEQTGVEKWWACLRDPALVGRKIREVFEPVLNRWISCRGAVLTFRAIQVVTSRGVFGAYLFRICKAETSLCEHCGQKVDTAQHTLAGCVAWVIERAALTAVVKPNLSLATVVKQLVRDKECWRAFFIFCKRLMNAKKKRKKSDKGNNLFCKREGMR